MPNTCQSPKWSNLRHEVNDRCHRAGHETPAGVPAVLAQPTGEVIVIGHRECFVEALDRLEVAPTAPCRAAEPRHCHAGPHERHRRHDAERPAFGHVRATATDVQRRWAGDVRLRRAPLATCDCRHRAAPDLSLECAAPALRTAAMVRASLSITTAPAAPAISAVASVHRLATTKHFHVALDRPDRRARSTRGRAGRYRCSLCAEHDSPKPWTCRIHRHPPGEP